MVTDSYFDTTESGRPSGFAKICLPDAAWLARREAEDALLPTLPIVDSHHHLWDRPGYRYLPEDLIGDIASGHNVVATVHVEVMSAYRCDGPEELRPVGETEFVADVVSSPTGGGPALGRAIIGFADLRLGAAVEDVLHGHLEAGRGRFRGVRFQTGWDAHPAIQNCPSGDRPAVLADPAVREAARKLVETGLSLDVWLFHTQLTDVVELADARPDLTIVLDHCGGPLGYGPYAKRRDEHFHRWRDGIRALAMRPNVVCKLGGLLARGAVFDYIGASEPPTSEALAGIWAPWLTTCIEEFGPHRCMFESNFPVEKMGTSYGTLWNAFKRVSAGASSAELHALFFDTALRTYRLKS